MKIIKREVEDLVFKSYLEEMLQKKKFLKNQNLNCFVIIKKREIVRTKFGSNHILEF